MWSNFDRMINQQQKKQHEAKSLQGDCSVEDGGCRQPSGVDAHSSSEGNPLKPIDLCSGGFHHHESSVYEHHHDLYQRQNVGGEVTPRVDLEPKHIQKYIQGEVIPDVSEDEFVVS